jgi:hypothetical protein
MLLSDIRDAVDGSKADRLASEDLIACLNALDHRPWPEINHGKPLTKAYLGRLLKPFKIAPGLIRLDDGRTLKGSYRHAFDDVFVRYAPATLAQNVTASHAGESAASSENPNVTSQNDVTFRNRENPSVPAGCDRVTDPEPLFWRDDNSDQGSEEAERTA